jgi:hypothetical protein
MFATYTLTKEELDIKFIENIKNTFDSNEIVISVESFDETEYLKHSKRNYELLLNSIKNAGENKNLIEVPFEEILKAANESN